MIGPGFAISLSLTEKVMLGTALLGGMSGVVGTFAVLRGRSLVGDMLAHAALPGICLAFLLMGKRNPLGVSLGALVSGLLAVGAVTLIVRWTRTKEDAAIGIVLTTFFGAGVVFLSHIQKPGIGGSKAGLNTYLFGEPGNMLTGDLLLLTGVGLVVLIMVGLLYKEFKIVCFDSDFAQSQGWPTLWLDLLMMAALAVVTIVGLPIVGVILMTAMIILPATTARFWTNQLYILVLLAGGLGIAAGLLGTYFGTGLPTGAAIVLTASSFFALSLLFAPGRGVIARIVAEYRLRKRIAHEHLLRSLYELSETSLPRIPTLEVRSLREYRYWRSLEGLLQDALEEGEIEHLGGNVQLTPLGLRRAAKLTKAHRLWEMYMMQNVGIAEDHVDRGADDVEHLLPEGLIVELEEQLANKGRLPDVVEDVPDSPHVLETEEPSP